MSDNGYQYRAPQPSYNGEKVADPHLRRESLCFKNLFNMIDVDNSGEISTDELQKALALAFETQQPAVQKEKGSGEGEGEGAEGEEIQDPKRGFNRFASEIFISLVDKNASGIAQALPKKFDLGIFCSKFGKMT